MVRDTPQLSRRFDGNVYQLEMIVDKKEDAKKVAQALRANNFNSIGKYAARVVPFKNQWVVYSQSRR